MKKIFFARDRGAVLAVLALAFVAMLVARFIRHVSLHDVPHVQDEVTYALQAHTFAAWRLVAPVLMPRAAFNTWYVDDRVTRFGIFPPGWPMVLALGSRIGLENWVNPLLHGLTTVIVGYLAACVAGRRSAILAAAFYAFSPQALLLASSLMSHTLVAACASVVMLHAWNHLKYRSPSIALTVAVGVAFALVACTRPLCFVVLALLDGAAVARHLWRTRRIDVRELAILGSLMLAGTALLFVYNRALTGSPTIFPQNVYFNEHLPPDDTSFFRYHHGCNNLGFGRGCDYSIEDANHTLENAFSNTGDNWKRWLLLAGGGPLVFILALACAFEKRTRRFGVVVVALVVLTSGAYALYWHPGTCYGARFYHLALPAVIVAGALGARTLRWRSARWPIIVSWLALDAVALRFGAHEIAQDYWGTDDRFTVLAREWTKPDAVVLVAFSSEEKPIPSMPWTTAIPVGGFWPLSIRAEAALGANDPFGSGRVVFAKYHPALVEDLEARFPARAFWVYVDHAERNDDVLVPLEDFHPPAEADLVEPVDNFEGYRPQLARPIPWKKSKKKAPL